MYKEESLLILSEKWMSLTVHMFLEILKKRHKKYQGILSSHIPTICLDKFQMLMVEGMNIHI
jgi:hypothetical protein